jgi:hypothetical protein
MKDYLKKKGSDKLAVNIT